MNRCFWCIFWIDAIRSPYHLPYPCRVYSSFLADFLACFAAQNIFVLITWSRISNDPALINALSNLHVVCSAHLFCHSTKTDVARQRLFINTSIKPEFRRTRVRKFMLPNEKLCFNKTIVMIDNISFCIQQIIRQWWRLEGKFFFINICSKIYDDWCNNEIEICL